MSSAASPHGRRRGRLRRTWPVVFVTALLVGVLAPMNAQAAHGLATLPGSSFEIDTDANLKVDHTTPPALDWANVAETRQEDDPSGQTDGSFGQGSKEDTTDPVIVDGGIPPNKSDLKFFGVYQEGTTASGFLNLFWSRVQDPSGTTNMDFEFNQNKCVEGDADSVCSDNGVTPERTAGDLLITYDLSRGGTVPVLSVREWTGSAWGTPTDVSASADAAGSINTSTVPAGDSDGLGALDPRTFGEAQIDLSAIFDTGECQTFGSAYLKSRSSDSFTAALKDFVPPEPVDISNCGSIKITKTDDADPATPLAGAEFTLYHNNPPLDAPRGDSTEDPVTDPVQKCTTGDNGMCTITNVLQGEYWVVETVTPDGHDTAPDQRATVVADEQVSLTFVNPRQRGAILVTKTRKHAADGPGDHPHAGVDFTVDGVTRTTDANGQACFDGLLFDDYTVSETEPNGYEGEGDKTVTVDNQASCADDPYGGETVSFSNTPLTDVTVSVDSQVDGGTASTIDCRDGDDTQVASGSTGANGDGSATASDLEPGTYTCTVVVDP